MASLRTIVSDNWRYIMDGADYVVIYKEGRSWQGYSFRPTEGDEEHGYYLDDADLAVLRKIAEVDHKAICINCITLDLPDYCDRKDYEDEILRHYLTRLSQLRGDFLEGMVVNYG